MPTLYVCNRCGKPGELNAEGVCESCIDLPSAYGSHVVRGPSVSRRSDEEIAICEERKKNKQCTQCGKRLTPLRYIYLILRRKEMWQFVCKDCS
jgi:hypothetical protein